jgi:hypothetical protein
MHYIYDDARSSPVKLWQSAQQIRLELLAFQHRVEPLLGFPLDGSIGALAITPDRVFIQNGECI